MKPQTFLATVAPLVLLVVAGPASLVLRPDRTLAQTNPSTPTSDAAARLAEGDRLLNLGVSQFNSSQLQEALQTWQQALDIFREPNLRAVLPLESRQRERNLLVNLGSVYLSLGDFQQAVTFYEQSLTITREINNAVGQPSTQQRAEGAALVGLGFAYSSLSQYQLAIPFFEQSLTIAREIDDPVAEVRALNGLGNAYSNLSQYELAISFHEQHLAIHREGNNRSGESIALTNLGNIYIQLGQYQQAIDYFQQSLTIAEEIGDRKGQAANLGNLGSVYRELGQYQQAITFHEQRLRITREIGDRQGEGGTLGNLGNVYWSLGQYEQAIDLHQQRLDIAREINDHHGEGNALSNLGNLHNSLGEHQLAVGFFEQGLTIFRQIGNRRGEGSALKGLGLASIGLGRYEQAIIFLEQSLAIDRGIGNRNGEGKSLSGIGYLYYLLDQFAASTNALQAAITIFDTLRTDDLPDSERITFFDTYIETYLYLQRSLVAQNEIDQALVYAEQGRARTFVDALISQRNGNAPLITPASTFTLSDIQRVAKEQNATLVQYSVISNELLYIWVIQPDGTIHFHLVDVAALDQNLTELVSITRTVLNARGRSLEFFLTPQSQEQQRQEQQQVLQQLYTLLIEPIAPHLPTNPNDRVILIPHQDLFMVPFPALVNAEGHYLIENHTLLTAPSIQVLDLANPSSSAGGRSLLQGDDMLIVGNPIMPRVWNPYTKQTETLSSLTGSEMEANGIADAFGTEALLQGNASEAAVVAQMPEARVIHLATHGLLEYGIPEESGVLDIPGAIALAPGDGEDGLLTAAEILEMSLRAELVVLSACDTGRGRITGDGVVGLSRAFMEAGVPSLVVSLWKVPDEPTAYLMTQFYDNWRTNPDRAQALRQAMLTTLEQYPDPLNWAAFTLVGQAE